MFYKLSVMTDEMTGKMSNCRQIKFKSALKFFINHQNIIFLRLKKSGMSHAMLVR